MIRDFVSPHTEEIVPAVKTSWLASERPPSVYDRAKAIFPAKGETHWALWLPATGVGVICLLATILGQLLLLAFATRARGAAATAAIVASFLIYLIAGSAAG